MNQRKIINEVDGDVFYYDNFIEKNKAQELYTKLYHQLPWQKDTIKVFGRDHLIPRQHCYMANDQNLGYAYSQKELTIYPFQNDIKKIMIDINNEMGLEFNAVLANLYEHGQHSNGWHADNEKSLGDTIHIASISLGASRKFKIKHNKKPLKRDILLENGSLLIMKAPFQEYWKHSIPKTAQDVAPRVNLTFRKIVN